MHRAPLMVLAITSFVPPLIACTRESSGTAVATSTSHLLRSLSASGGQSSEPSTTTATASTTADPAHPDPKNKGKCAPLAERVRVYVEANRSCASAADCVEVHTTCGAVGACGTYVSRGKEAGLRKVSDELEAINCFALGVFPCATCGAPPPPTCVGGKCTP